MRAIGEAAVVLMVIVTTTCAALGDDELFFPPVQYPTGDGPTSVAIGDLDRDEVPDLAVANQNSNNVSVLLGLGDGTFADAEHYDAGDWPQSVAIGDLNKDEDEWPDLAVANRDSDTVSVLLGVGDGTFAAAVHYDAGDGPRSVAIGDLDGDEVPDLAVANANSDNVSVLLGVGDGTFAAAVHYPAGDSPRSVAIGDLDGDGVLDLAVANYLSDNVSVLLGVGDGTFHDAEHYPAGDSPRSVAIGDLDGDAVPDLAVANRGSDNVSVLLGLGDGTFADAEHYDAGAGPFSVAIGDLDGDCGVPDLAVANVSSDDVSVLLGLGDGTFHDAEHYAAGDGPVSIAIGDLDGDQVPDLAVANHYDDNVSVLLGTGQAQATDWEAAPSLDEAREMFGAAVDECGNIWVAGGFMRTSGCSYADGPVLDSIEVLEYDGESYATSWALAPTTMPTPRLYPAIAVANGFLYVIGGYETLGEPVPIGQVDRYDLTTGTWDTVGDPLTTPRYDHGCTVDRRGRIWVVGGVTASGAWTGTVEIYDPVRPELGWQAGPELNQARARFGCVMDRKGRLYAIGGYVGESSLSSTERLDPCGSGEWEVLPSALPDPLSNGAKATLGGDGRIYVGGGWVPHHLTDRVLRLAPDGDTWQDYDPLIEARSQHELVLGHDGYIYAIGGDSCGCYSIPSVEKLYTGPPAAILGDINGDGSVNFFDIDPFVELIMQ